MAQESYVALHAVVAVGGNIDEWTSSGSIALGDIVMPTEQNGHSYICTTSGTTGATEPVWTLISDSALTPTDGDVEWTENGIDADKICGIGTWSLGANSYAEIDDTAFCDDDMKFKRGLRSASEISFSGNYKSDDTAGQDIIVAAFWDRTNMTDLRLYVGSASGAIGYSYYAPNDSLLAGGRLPAGIPVSHIKIMSAQALSADKTGLTKIDFTGKVQGAMRFFEFT